MLADDVRFDAYRRAVAKHIQPGDTVVDVGTGSGVLSFLAATRKPAKIYAIDHSNFIEVAKYIAQKNGIDEHRVPADAQQQVRSAAARWTSSSTSRSAAGSSTRT